MRNYQLPLSEEDLLSLKAGDCICLSGKIYTARDAAHKKIKQLIDANQQLPLDLENQIIYYVGPTKTPPGFQYGSGGPTTSSRMDAYSEMMLMQGMRGAIGKGKRSAETKRLFKEFHAIYFVAIGGAGAYLGQCVKKATPIAFEELQSESIQCLEIEEFPVFVGLDLDGNDIYD